MIVISRVLLMLATTAVFCVFYPLKTLADGDEDDTSDGDPPVAEFNENEGPDQGAGTTSGPTASSGTAQISTRLTAPTVAPATTASVVARINSATGYCQLIQPSAYTVDCLSERLGELATLLEGQPEFAEVQIVLSTTSAKLHQIARNNGSGTRPAAKFSAPGRIPVTTTRHLIPVDDARLATAVLQAIDVIDQAQTLLLRSAETSGSRSVQFQRIATAIGSNKVLLRSI